jgi:hypothetical protein
VRPISGWTAVNVTRTGKNLLPNVKYQTTNTNVRLGNINEYSLYLPKGTYTLSVEYLNGNHSGAFYRFQSDTANRNIWISSGTATSGTFTIDKDEPFTLWLYQSGGFSADDVGNFWIELGSTATAYEPYVGTTYPVTLPTEAGTIYGGTLDVVKGTLTVTSGYIASYNGETLPSTWISDRDVYAEGVTPTIGAEVVYELATPTTYTLTPTEIRTLLGHNTLWADAGAVDVQYPADTKLYIDGKIAELQALILENNG